MQDQRNYGYDQQDVNQSGGHVENHEREYPTDQQNKEKNQEYRSHAVCLRPQRRRDLE